MIRTIVIAAGGTGGHISPGIAIAEAISEVKSQYGVENIYIHSLERNKENPDLKDSPCQVIWHNMPPFTAKAILFPFVFLWNLLSTFIKFQSLKVDCVIAMGGYSSIPALLYALLFRKKIFLCEQNRILGKVNRYFLKFADKISLSLPVLDQDKIKSKYCIVGNPLRKKILPDPLFPTKARVLDPKEKINVLVMGGSQGARQINNMVLSTMENSFIKQNFLFRLLTGTNLYQETIEKVKSSTNIYSYSNDMKVHYEWADLVIARSGAGVLFECMAYGLPMVLIPYPFAADNHQLENAVYCKENCDYIVISRNDEDNTELMQLLSSIANDRSILEKISQKTLQQAKVKAAEDTVKFFLTDND